MTVGLATLATVGGVALVLVTLRDVFHTLFHPGGTGSAGAALRRVLWRGFRAVAAHRGEALVLAGPCMLVLTVALWAAAVAVGWALVLWPHLPEGFRFASALSSSAERGLDTALYVSFVTLTTLGFGDVTPTAPGLRLLCALEAAVGFVLLTAGISWIQSVYPVLSRRRALAGRAHALRTADDDTGVRVDALEPAVAAAQLADLAAAIATVHVDLVQTGITYYFTEMHERSALAAHLPYLLRVADAGLARADAPAVRHAARQLRTALADYADTVRTDYLRTDADDPAAVLARHARDHRPQRADDA